MKEMPSELKQLQSDLGKSDFAFLSAGRYSLSEDVYPAVKEEFPQYCDDQILCSDVCNGGSSSPEWRHRVRTVLHRLANNSNSRVEKLESHGMWSFRDSVNEGGLENFEDSQDNSRNTRELPFEIGRTYHRVEEIHEEYGGNRYSGIAPCAGRPYVFIFFGESGEWHGYDDELRSDGRLFYTGEGRDGDMTMDAGNAAIRDHAKDNNEIHVFESAEGAWEVTYVGQFEYEDHHWTRLPDRSDNMRDAIRFELVPTGGLEIDTGVTSLNEISLDELYEQAELSVTGEGQTTTESRSRTTYRRSDIVREYALQAADGVCQGCGNEAPFTGKDGEPFLEVHHLHRRSDGGPDHPDNVIALCPNCHRRVHQGEDGNEFNRGLITHVENRDRIADEM